MTGELTLTGEVLPVGGIKEKVIAAHRAGVRDIILPEENEKDYVEEIPEDVRKALRVHFVRDAETLLGIAFSSGASGAKKRAARSKR